MAYLRLLWIYYDTENPIADEPKRLAFQIGASAEDVEMILEHFFDLNTVGMRTHKRCDIVIEEYHSKSEKASNSANVRWKNAKAKREQSERNANASKNDANQEPITKKKKTPLKAPPPETDGQQVKAARAALTLTEGGNKEKATTFEVWYQDCLASGARPLTEYKAMWEYAETVGLTSELIGLAWAKFKQHYQTEEKGKRKRYTDWKRVFLRSVKEGWFRLWVIRDGEFILTTIGQQAWREMKEAA
jgi:uncharacterized protein YdaU (DUF1376 family)